jgi:hypothetical protein
MRFGSIFRLSAAVGVTVAGLSEAAALDRRVRIVNESSHAIIAFHGANVGTSDWGENMLGQDVLPPKGNVVLNFEDGSGYCRFGFRATFDDGVELEKKSVNICEIGTYRYTD